LNKLTTENAYIKISEAAKFSIELKNTTPKIMQLLKRHHISMNIVQEPAKKILSTV
jgi:hypothetical protein